MNVSQELESIRKLLREINRRLLKIRREGGGGAGDHNLLSATHLDTLVAAVQSGDIIIGNNTPKWSRLAKQNNNDVLTLIAGIPSWQPPAGGGGDLNDGCLFGKRLQHQYYSNAINCAAAPNRVSQTLDFLRAAPFLVSKQQNFDRIGSNVTGVGGGKLRLGIYESLANGTPGALVLDSGEIDSSVSGDAEAVINQTLTVGLYWLVHIGKVTQAIRCWDNSMCIALLGNDDMGFTQPSTMWYKAQAYGALPDPFTVGGATAEWGASIAIFLRKS